MKAKLMNGTYYEYIGRYMDTYETEKTGYRSKKEAKIEARNTEKDCYLTTYENGILISVKTLIGNRDLLDYPRRKGITYYEDLSDGMKFRYMMLSKMQADCEYVLGCGGKGAMRYLVNKSIPDHISEMKDRLNSFKRDEKPEWLTLSQIEEYERKMQEICAA